jgi:sugar lactone lactonase YvrE
MHAMARARLLVPFLLFAIVPACGGGNGDPDPDAGGGGGGNPDAGGGGNPDASIEADGGADAGGADAGQPLTFSAIAPTSGYYPGGQRATITGTHFDGSTTVSIGGHDCPVQSVNSATELVCLVPSGVVGAADVVVASDDGMDTGSGAFTYVDFTRVDTIAGTGTPGSTNGAGDVAELSTSINGFFITGDTMYVADGLSYQVRTVDLSGLSASAPSPTDVTVATLAGSGVIGDADSSDSTGATATFRQPDAVGALIGQTLYVTDTDWSGGSGATETTALRTIDVTNGATATTAVSGAGFGGMTWDGASYLYIADCSDGTIVRVDVGTGEGSVWAGSSGASGDVLGSLTDARFSCPYDLAWNGDRTVLYVSDYDNRKVKAIDVAAGMVSLLAGTGASGQTDDPSGASASFSNLNKLASAGRYLFVTDIDNCAVRQIDLESTAVTTVVGSSASCTFADGALADAGIPYPDAIAYDPRFGIFVAGADWGWRPETPSSRIQLIH